MNAVASTLRVVCAWCRETIKEGSEPVSHGICASCYERECPSGGAAAVREDTHA